MITSLKNLFSKTPATEPLKQDILSENHSGKKLKTRVRPFTKTADPWYICEYFDGEDWVEFTEIWTNSDTPRLWKRDHLKIFQKFDDAVDFCRKWSSLDEVKACRQEMDKIFDNKLAELQIIIDSKQKTWESE